jgi:hypothetical protein
MGGSTTKATERPHDLQEEKIIAIAHFGTERYYEETPNAQPALVD